LKVHINDRWHLTKLDKKAGRQLISKLTKKGPFEYEEKRNIRPENLEQESLFEESLA